MQNNLRRMTSALTHRGPDERGLWLDREAGIALGYRRLASLEQPATGSKTMVSPEGRYCLALHGTLYNHKALRKQLAREGHTQWRNRSDSETLLTAFACWGLQRTLQACRGTFAMALWDNKIQRLTLVRDRMGEKPLYYGWAGQTFLFGSELHALQAHHDWKAPLNRDALACQLHLGYIPAPLTIYQQIAKLQPGHCLHVTPHSIPGNPLPSQAWWSLPEHITRARHNPSFQSVREATAMLETLLNDAIRQQIPTDRVSGAFLSGNVASALLTTLMQAHTSRPIKTFNLGFETNTPAISGRAQDIARYLGTEHSEFIASPDDIRDLIPQLPTLFDEPFSDIAQIPALLLAQLGRNRVMVGLSGNGANELFGCHQRYRETQRHGQHLGHLPGFLRGSFAGLLGLDTHSHHIIPHWQQPEEVMLGIQNAPALPTPSIPAGLHLPERMMYLDTVDYLPNNSLNRAERTGLATGLDIRSPFLDERIVAFAWQLPLHLKIHDTQGSWILRQILGKYLPPALMTQAADSRGIPLAHWLRTFLREWAEHLLNPARLRQEGFFDPSPIQEKWQQHLAGTRDWHNHLWDILIFQAWHEHQTTVTRAMAA